MCGDPPACVGGIHSSLSESRPREGPVMAPEGGRWSRPRGGVPSQRAARHDPCTTVDRGCDTSFCTISQVPDILTEFRRSFSDHPLDRSRDLPSEGAKLLNCQGFSETPGIPRGCESLGRDPSVPCPTRNHTERHPNTRAYHGNTRKCKVFRNYSETLGNFRDLGRQDPRSSERSRKCCVGYG